MGKQFYVNQSGSDSLGLVADWTHALNNNGDLAEVLDRLRSLTKAEATMVVRLSKTENKTRYVTRCGSQNGKIWPIQPRSCAQAVLGQCMGTAKVGSLWKLSDSNSSGLDLGAAQHDDYAKSLVEAIVIPLESTSGHADFLELHFWHHPAEHDLNLIVMLIGTLAVSWKRRAPGIITKKLEPKLKLSQDYSEDRVHAPILGTENPAQLSRCEFRVSTLLSEGMTVNMMAQALSISPATVRSHLSSIFSKTDVSSQIELVHLLNGKSESYNDCDSEKTLRIC